jgi:hypothetical protein
MKLMLTLDQALERQVIEQADDLIKKILSADNAAVTERLLGRVLARFARPSEHRVSGTLKALHLVAGVDFGSNRRK